MKNALALALTAAFCVPQAPAFGRQTFTGHRMGRKDGPESVKETVLAALKERDAGINTLITKANEEVAAHGKMLDETRNALDLLVKTSGAMQAQLEALEQAFVANKLPQNELAKSIGEQFTDMDSFKILQSKGVNKIVMHLKAVTNITSLTTGTGGAGAAIAPDRLAGIITPATRQMTIRDLLLQGRTSSNVIQYVKETGFQNTAAAVAEGTAKPQADLSFALVSANVTTIAYWVRASVQILDDVPQLQSYIDTRLRYGLAYVEEAQLLAGDGTGVNLLGLIPQATVFNEALRVTGDQQMDTIRRAILQVRLAEFRASGIVLNPQDWANIQLLKNTQGTYLWANPAVVGPGTLWGLPVVETTAMPVGHFMVGAFDIAAQVFDRQDANVQLSTEDGTNFTTNMVTIRAEERLALCVYRPASFVYGPFVAV